MLLFFIEKEIAAGQVHKDNISQYTKAVFSVIFGAGGQARETVDLLLRQGYTLRDLLFYESRPVKETIKEIEIVSMLDLLSMKSEITWVYVAIGNPPRRIN